MHDIAELERRITAALERIANGLDRTPIAMPQSDEPVLDGTDVVGKLTTELARQSAALDEEQMANAQLVERLRVVREKEAKLREALEDQIAALMRQLDDQGLELAHAHRTMVLQGGQLRNLREAAVSMVADPALINHTMEVEMEALRATRGAEVSELEDILAALDPLIAEEGVADARA